MDILLMVFGAMLVLVLAMHLALYLSLKSYKILTDGCFKDALPFGRLLSVALKFLAEQGA
jgi:hypothetical protein